ncbi:MAG TPA: hypothetical protein VMH39_05460 [Gemmatimonadaceae bacterium]|nr:hypothetical protein [Gemmatimonadaceae bacterium]
MAKVTRERAERIAKAHACENCGEYSYKKLSVKRATPDLIKEFGEAWHAVKTCGVCSMEMEMGIGPDGDVLYVT